VSTAWVDGVLVADDQPAVRASDHGLLVGDGVFETAKVIDGTPFALTRHVERLRRSAKGLGLEVPQDDDVLSAAAAEVLAANQPGVGRLRITVTGGPGPLGSGRGTEGPTVIVASGPPGDWPPAAAVIVVPWPRNERSPVAGLKTTSYAENVVALARATEAGAGEALFANLAGNLCEGTGSNVFVGVDGRLRTPPLSSGCLAGITRDLLLEITDAVEADLPIDDLARADEAFLSSSTREIQPIATVDGRALRQCPGPLTRQADAAFADLVARDLDP
jgi:branched-chain amino acid aminotransferase